MALSYDLRREAHAIGEFSATLSFVSGVGVQTFANVLPLLKQAANALNLPATMNMQVLNIAINSPPVPTAGSGFQRFAANGEIACSLWCDQDSITLTLREYDRWHSVLPKLVDTFASIAPAYMAEVPAIRLFSLQYLNEFRAKTPSVQSAAELFRTGSKWISPFAYESNEPWHCHVGQFISTMENFRYLVNINCDVAPTVFAQEQRVLNHAKVLILSACHYDVPGFGPLIAQVEDIRETIESGFNNAHQVEKGLLKELISDNYLAIMGEGASEY